MTINYVIAPDKVFVNGSLAAPICLLCDKPITDHEYSIAPWGSDFEGGIIHNKCYHKHFDPVIARIQAERVKDGPIE